MATLAETSTRAGGMTKDEKFVIFASSLGTVFEWYDFYLYATLAPFFAALFFPPGNDTAALLSAFATYAAGFLVRPFGALIFGRIGDLVGRKYTFLVTIVVMGTATFLVGLLPTFSQIGWVAPILLVTLRLCQGLALGGEYGGAATCAIAAVTYFPLFAALTHYVNPDLEAFAEKNPITISADQSTCNFHIFVGPWSNFTQCDRAQDFMTKSGLSFKTVSVPGAKGVDLTIGSTKVEGWDNAKWQAALNAAGYPAKADLAKVNWFMTELILVIMVIYVTMVYGPIAAFLVEMFSTNIRYTSMSLPYHIGNGWFGGMLPLLATAVVAATGNIYAGLWYPIGVAVMTLIVGSLFLRDTRGVNIATGSGVAIQKT